MTDSSTKFKNTTGPRTAVSLRKDLWMRIYRISHFRDISWTRVTYRPVNSSKHLVSASGRVLAGQIVSVWGPVDSGVDTLAQIIFGTIKDHAGEVKGFPQETSFVEDVYDDDSLFLEKQNLRETIEFYVKTLLSGTAIPPSEISIESGDVVREFDLELIQFKECCNLNPTERKLLHLICMLLNPAPILIMHNPTRGLSVQHRQLIANRLRILALTGHTILLLNSFSCSIFFEMSDYVHVIHACGKSLYAGSPREFGSFLQRNGFDILVNQSSYEDLIFCSISIEQKDFSNMIPCVEAPPDGTHFVPDTLLNPDGNRMPPFVLPMMQRTWLTMFRHELLFRAKLLIAFCFTITCSVLSTQKPVEVATIVVDLFLIYTAGCNMVFATLESHIIDKTLSREFRGPLRRLQRRTEIICIRLFFIVICDFFFTLACTLLLSSFAGFPHDRDCLVFGTTMSVCALFFTFVGGFCGLHKGDTLNLLIHLMILLFVSSVMTILSPVDTSDSFIRLLNPVYLAKTIILSKSTHTNGIVERGKNIHTWNGRLISKRVNFVQKFTELSLCSVAVLALYVARFREILK